jgi:hypothetical protein
MNSKGEVLAVMAEIYGDQLTKPRAHGYMVALSDLTLEEMKLAFGRLTNDPEVIRLPLPAKIIEAARPQLSVDDESKEAAGRVLTAISRFGYPNPRDAREFIGELGWRCVELQGGWAQLCQSTHDRQLPMLQAQFRELAKSQHKKARIGKLDEVPSLPDPDSNLTRILKIKGVGE